MTERQAYVDTRASRAAFQAVIRLAKSRGGVLLLVAAYGMGKTRFCEMVVERLAWEFPLEKYVRQIQGQKSRAEVVFSFGDALALGRECGLVDETNRRSATEFLEEICDARRWSEDLGGYGIWLWLDALARKRGRPGPDPFRLLPLFGIAGQPAHRYPLLITGEGTDTPGGLCAKLLRALQPTIRIPKTYRRFQLQDLLREMPIVLLVDEADMLSVDCLHMTRQLCDQTGTPYLLAGSKRLVARLEATPDLRALASRVEAQVTLDGATAADLREAYPDLPNEILLAVWTASGRSFRTAALIAKMLRGLREAFPERRLNRRAVAFAASQVLAANADRIDVTAGEDAQEVPPAAAVAGGGRRPVAEGMQAGQRARVAR
jgi:hypothetical protein